MVENLDDSDQITLGRDFIRHFDVMIDLKNGLTKIRKIDRKYVKRPVKRIKTDRNKIPNFWIKLQRRQVVVAIFRMRNFNSLSDRKQVYLVSKPKSHCSIVLGCSFSVTRNGLSASVLFT